MKCESSHGKQKVGRRRTCFRTVERTCFSKKKDSLPSWQYIDRRLTKSDSQQEIGSPSLHILAAGTRYEILPFTRLTFHCDGLRDSFPEVEEMPDNQRDFITPFNACSRHEYAVVIAQGSPAAWYYTKEYQSYYVGQGGMITMIARDYNECLQKEQEHCVVCSMIHKNNFPVKHVHANQKRMSTKKCFL